MPTTLELIDDCKRDILEGAPGGLTCGLDKENTPGHPFLTSVDLYQEGETYTMVLHYRADKPEATLADVFPAEEPEDKLAAFRFLNGLKGMPLDCAATLLAALYQEAYDAEMEAKLQAALELGSGQTGGISLYATMCEPGYQSSKAIANPEAFKGYLTANWNHIDKELGDWLDASDAYDSGHWSDEWTDCVECGGLIRVTGDCWGWKFFGKRTDSGDVCGTCLMKDIPAYLEELEGKSNTAVTLSVDPTQHGYIKVSDERGFEHGFHPGQTADPRSMAATLRKAGIHRFLWFIDGVGQFDISFSLYIHEEIKDELPRVKELLGA